MNIKVKLQDEWGFDVWVDEDQALPHIDACYLEGDDLENLKEMLGTYSPPARLLWAQDLVDAGFLREKDLTKVLSQGPIPRRR